MKTFAFTPALFNVDMAAHYLGVSKATIKEWLSEGRLQPYPLPGIRGRHRLDKTVFVKEELERCVGLIRK